MKICQPSSFIFQIFAVELDRKFSLGLKIARVLFASAISMSKIAQQIFD